MNKDEQLFEPLLLNKRKTVHELAKKEIEIRRSFLKQDCSQSL